MKNLKEKKCFLLDMDGTIYLGDRLIEGADEFLNLLKEKGKIIIYLTNNSSKNKNECLEKLLKMGIKAEAENIFTSGEATILYLKKLKKGANIFLLASKAVEDEFISYGFNIIKERGRKDVDFVVVGLDTSLTYEKLWWASEYVAGGAKFIATNPDLVCPLDNGTFMPDTASLAAPITTATGIEPEYIGKPKKHMLDVVMERYSLTKDDLVIVGDRLYTDIRTGTDNGITSVLVMTGETDEKMLKETKFVPDYIFNSVKELSDNIK